MTLQKWALSSPSCAARWSEKQKNGRVKQQHRNMQLKVCYDKNLMHQIDLGDLQLVLIWALQETIQSIYGLKLNHSCIWETLNSNITTGHVFVHERLNNCQWNPKWHLCEMLAVWSVWDEIVLRLHETFDVIKTSNVDFWLHIRHACLFTSCDPTV